ncbi:hypothetical protein OG379_41010 (plasmid) [Streptomyces sp. NBC_01166]|uniref:hypothetical protein n=1 Tax=Streptomyces sp. NBC_01166 TaxID=2903755 RepID=UPI002F9139C6|nr:hypothetical protein OG379_41010 [Streptomyces sp. NBC_01166]
MDEYLGLTAFIESAWQELNDPDTDRRHFCLDAISDVLETGRLTQSDAERTVERLVAVALSDEGYPVRESSLHAACTAATLYELPYQVVKPLAVGADGLEPLLLTYVLGILGSTHDQAALPIIERFHDHPHPEVRREVEEAVHELRWSGESSQGGTA